MWKIVLVDIQRKLNIQKVDEWTGSILLFSLNELPIQTCKCKDLWLSSLWNSYYFLPNLMLKNLNNCIHVLGLPL